MMNKRKLSAAAAAAVMTASVFTGCGTDDVILTQNEYTEISLSWWGNDARIEYTLDAVKEFERQHPDIRVKCSYSEWSGYQTRYRIQMASNTESDVMLINFAWLDQYSADGNGYYDINTLSDYFDRTQFGENELEFGIRNGKLNAVPIALNTQTVYINKSVYDSFGAPVPRTWDDLFTAAKAMNGEAYPLTMPAKSMFFYIVSHIEQTTGKTFMTDDGRIGFGTDEIAMMLECYKQLVNEKVMPSVEYFDKNELRNGKAAGSVAWLSDASNYMGSAQDEGYEVIVAEYTGSDSGLGMYTKPATMYAISSNTEHPNEAAMLLDFLMNSDEISELQGIEKGIPLSLASRKYLEEHDMLNGLQYDAFTEMNKHLENMRLIDPIMENTDLLDAFQDSCNAVLFDKAPSEEKAAELLERFNEILGI